MSTFRVWLRKNDVVWWEPVDADTAEAAVLKLSRTKRKLVSKVNEITHEPTDLTRLKSRRRGSTD